MNLQEMTAPCGLACWTCAYHKENITNELADMAARQIGIDSKDVPCEGCRSEQGCSFGNALTDNKGCPTKNCVEEKGIHNCSECDEFPCENLMPVMENASTTPHNTKLYNLNRIKLVGIEAWGENAGLIQEKYFKGKFVYGAAPRLGKDE